MKSLAAAGLILMVASPIWGGIITVSYSGQISFSQEAGISVGDDFTGSFTYTAASPLLFDGSPAYLAYSLDQPGDSLALDVDGFVFDVGESSNLVMNVQAPDPTYGHPSLNVQDDDSGPEFSTNYPLNGQAFGVSEVQFQGDPQFLTSLAIPTTFDAADVIFGSNTPPYPTSAVIEFFENGSASGIVTASIESVQATVSETPEPQTSLMFWLGVALFGLRTARWRRLATPTSPAHKS